MAQNIAFFLFSRKLLQDSEDNSSSSSVEQEGGGGKSSSSNGRFEDVRLNEEDEYGDEGEHVEVDYGVEFGDDEDESRSKIPPAYPQPPPGGRRPENGSIRSKSASSTPSPAKKTFTIKGVAVKQQQQTPDSANGKTNNKNKSKNSKQKKNSKQQSPKWKQFIFWIILLAIFAILTVWHWVVIIVNYNQPIQYDTYHSTTKSSHVRLETSRNLSFPNPTVCFPLYLDYVPFTVYAVDPYVPSLRNWTQIKDTLHVVLPRTNRSRFFDTPWNVTSNGRAFLFTSAALLSRLTELEQRDSATHKRGELKWEEAKVEVTDDVLIKTNLKVDSVERLWKFLDRINETNDLSRLYNKVGKELCNVIKLKAFLMEEKDFFYNHFDQVTCEATTMTWISKRATCLRIDLKDRFRATKSEEQAMISLDLSYLYGEFLMFVDFYEKNFTLGAEGRAWFTQSTTLNLGGDRRVTHYFAPDSTSVMPGAFNKYLLEIVGEYQGDPKTDNCAGKTDPKPSKNGTELADAEEEEEEEEENPVWGETEEDCRDRCHAEVMAANCRRRCVPYTWRHLLKDDKWPARKHCSLADYNICLRYTKNQTLWKECASDCKRPCHTKL